MKIKLVHGKLLTHTKSTMPVILFSKCCVDHDAFTLISDAKDGGKS
jgi:hypothetical protein